MGIIEASKLTKKYGEFTAVFIAVLVSEVFEAQTFSNFFRFPMVFLCGLLIPFILPGCWKAKELNERVIVLAGGIRVTFQAR